MEEKIGTIKDILADTAIEDISAFIAKYSQDERKGVVKLVDSARKKLEAYEKEKERIYMMHEFEREYASYGYICGIDEACRSCCRRSCYSSKR